MSVCYDDWLFSSEDFPGSACRLLDFNLAFSSLVLAIIPCTVFILLSAFRLRALRKKQAKTESRSFGGRCLYYGKLALAAINTIGCILAIIGGSRSKEFEGTGIAALVLAIPTAVSLVTFIRTPLKYIR